MRPQSAKAMSKKQYAAILLTGLLAGCMPPRNSLLECVGRFSLARTVVDSAAIVGQYNNCAWYVGWKQIHK